MKNSVIIDIFNGEKGNRENMILANKNKEKAKELLGYYDKLKDDFTIEQRQFVEKILDTYDKTHYGEIDFYYTEGFKLGFRLAVE